MKRELFDQVKIGFPFGCSKSIKFKNGSLIVQVVAKKSMTAIKSNWLFSVLKNSRTAIYGGCIDAKGSKIKITDDKPCNSAEDNGTSCYCKSDKCNHIGAFDDHNSQHVNSSEKSVPFLFIILMFQIIFAYLTLI